MSIRGSMGPSVCDGKIKAGWERVGSLHRRARRASSPPFRRTRRLPEFAHGGRGVNPKGDATACDEAGGEREEKGTHKKRRYGEDDDDSELEGNEAEGEATGSAEGGESEEGGERGEGGKGKRKHKDTRRRQRREEERQKEEDEKRGKGGSESN